MSLRSLLYLLFSSISFASQDVFRDSDRDSGLDSFSLHPVLATKTITYNEQTPLPAQNSSDLDNISCPDCCSADHCFPGDYCYEHSGKGHCCPQGVECFQISGSVCFDQTIVWYDEIHIVEDTDSTEVATAWDLHESVQRAKTRLTVTASYPSDGRSLYSSLSSSVLEAAATSSLVLDTTSTRTITIMSSPTSDPLVDGRPDL